MNTRRPRAARLALYGAVVAVSGATVANSLAQSTIPYAGGSYTQNFDGLPNTGLFSFTGVGPFDLQNAPPNGVGATGMPGWSFAKFGGTGPNAVFVVDAGTSTAGGAHSYGDVGSSERALGSLASGTVIPAFGAIFVNNTGSTLGSFTLNYTMEQWRNGGATISNTLSFSYGVGNADILTGSFVTATALDATSVVSGIPAGPLNGNLPANQAAVGGTVSGFSWLPGQALVIRWTDANDDGSDHGIAIDDFSLSAAPAGRNLVWNGGPPPPGNLWTHNPAFLNWRDGPTPTSFMVNDNANFTNIFVGQVQVDGGGVTPGAINVSNDGGVYNFTGGPIGGNGVLTKTGSGLLGLSNNNTYTGGTVINGGVVLINNNEALGAASGGITMGGGELETGSALSSTRNISFTPGSTSTINTSGNNASFAGTSGAGGLVKQGSGALTFSGAYNMTGLTSVAAGSLRLGQSGGVVNLNTGTGGTDFVGDLEIVNGIRVNLDSGNFSGGGKLRVHAPGTIISTDGGQQMLTASVGNGVELNAQSLPQPFSTTIGATIMNSITFGGVIGGASDVSFASSTPGLGTGVIILNNQNTWTGATTVNFGQAGVVRLGSSNALPPGTDLHFGTGDNNAGALDLAGFNQSVNSLRSDTTGVVNGIVNTAATLQGGPVVFTVTGNQVTTFSGTIGVPPEIINLPGANDNIAVVLSSSHTGDLTLTGTNTYNGGTTLNGGALSVANDNNMGAPTGALNFGGGTLRTLSSVTSARPINVNLGDAQIDTSGFNSVMSGPISGPGSLIKRGAGELSVTAVNSAGLNVDAGDVKVVAGPAPNSLSGLSNIDVLVIAGGPSSPTARLDLTNNAMIIGSTPADGGPDAEAVVGGYISSGYAGGSWEGKGIASTSADFGEGNRGLGYADAGAIGVVTFLGVPVLATDSLIRFTLYGDANLDGVVNLPDFNRLAANFGSTNAVWRQGDFNYDGLVNLQDFNRLAANFGLSAGPDGPTPSDWAALASVVPEPAGLGIIVLCGAGLLKRRRVV